MGKIGFLPLLSLKEEDKYRMAERKALDELRKDQKIASGGRKGVSQEAAEIKYKEARRAAYTELLSTTETKRLQRIEREKEERSKQDDRKKP